MYSIQLVFLTRYMSKCCTVCNSVLRPVCVQKIEQVLRSNETDTESKRSIETDTESKTIQQSFQTQNA